MKNCIPDNLTTWKIFGQMMENITPKSKGTFEQQNSSKKHKRSIEIKKIAQNRHQVSYIAVNAGQCPQTGNSRDIVQQKDTGDTMDGACKH